MLDDRRRGAHRRLHVTVIAEQVHQRGFDVARPSAGRRVAEACGHPAAEGALGHPEFALELDARDSVHGLELVVDRHAAGRGVNIDLDRLEAAQAMEVGDGLADVAHRQRAADASLDQIDERRLGGALSLDVDGHLADRLGDVPGRRRLLPARGGRHEQQCAQRNRGTKTHQKLRRTLKSTENWRSLVCVSTQPTRSL